MNLKKRRKLIIQILLFITASLLIFHTYYKDNNDKKCQVTLIEIENIEDYNLRFGTSIPPINFRRNIITEGV